MNLPWHGMPNPPEATGNSVFVLFPLRPMPDAGWWSVLLPIGYRHVYAARGTNCGQTLVLTHEGHELRTELVQAKVSAYVANQNHILGSQVLLYFQPPPRPRALLRPPMTCVEAVKAWIGIDAPWLITPRQLSRYLRRHGALCIH